MVSNVELESKFKAFSQDYERTKNTLNQLCERVCSIEAKLEDLSTVLETLDKLEAAILATYPDRIATYQELQYSKLYPSSSPLLLASIAPVIHLKSDR
jgi:hypothetical protein